MLCRKCSATIPDESAFCMVCGIKQIKEQVNHKPRTRGNGLGSVYRLPDGKWRAAVTLGYERMPNGQNRRIYKTKSGFKTKKEALEYIPMLKQADQKPKDMLLSALYTEWSATTADAISKSTYDGYRNCYEKYCGSIKHRKLSDIKVAELQRCVDDCKQSPRMKQLVKVTLSSMFKYAMQNDYIQKNYASFIKVPKQIKPDKDAFSESEIATIWEAYNSGNTFMRYPLVMIYTGLRPAELRQITPRRIDLSKKVLVAGVKTEKGINREIPLCDKIIPLVSNADFSFDRNEFYKKYKSAFDGMPIRYLPPHCCRHTAATALVLAGVDYKIIQEILGHSSFSVTADNYVHIPMGEKLGAVNKIK